MVTLAPKDGRESHVLMQVYMWLPRVGARSRAPQHRPVRPRVSIPLPTRKLRAAAMMATSDKVESRRAICKSVERGRPLYWAELAAVLRRRVS